MLSYDHLSGSNPKSFHNHAYIPSLSQWIHDKIPYHTCCLWQSERSNGCEIYRNERRPSQDCVAYQTPIVGSIFGDPHIITFDGLEYTFNAIGEFVLVKSFDALDNVEIHGRFEHVARNLEGSVNATQLTAIAVKSSTSTVVEIRLRPQIARNRYHLDVFFNGRRIYFDQGSKKEQFFDGITAYTPPNILNQSHVILALSSSTGIEVIEELGYVTVNVFLPWNYIVRILLEFLFQKLMLTLQI